MDLIRAFNGRPKKIYTKDEIEAMRYKLVQDSLRVKEEIEEFKNKNSDGTATRSCNYKYFYIFFILLVFFSSKKRNYNNTLNALRINVMKIQSVFYL